MELKSIQIIKYKLFQFAPNTLHYSICVNKSDKLKRVIFGGQLYRLHTHA